MSSLRWRTSPCCLLHATTASAPRIILLTPLDTPPIRAPVNASPVPSRIPAHDSGPVRFATPSSWRTFTTYSLPVSPAHRRKFIALAGGAVAWPLVVYAQQTHRVRRVGVLVAGSPPDSIADELRRNLRDLGYSEGQ